MKQILITIAAVVLAGCESVPDSRNSVYILYTLFYQSEAEDIKDKKIEISMNDKISDSNLVRKTYKARIKNALTTNNYNVTDETRSGEILLYINFEQQKKAEMIGSNDYGYFANGWFVSGGLYNAKELQIILYKNKHENANLQISDSQICEFEGKILSPIGIDTADIIEQFFLFSSKDFFSESGRTREVFIPNKVFKD